jgi:hypothetical protein
MSVVMVTAAGEEHGLINQLANSVEFNDFKQYSPANKAKLEKEKKEDARVVKARYINHRGRHERLDKNYVRYPGDPILQYHLIPGNCYELPMGFIKEVNEVRIAKRSGLVSEDGNFLKKDESPLERDGSPELIHELVPLTFN